MGVYEATEAFEGPWVLASRLRRAEAERDAYRAALAVIARDVADDGSVTQAQVDAAYALARACARGAL